MVFQFNCLEHLVKIPATHPASRAIWAEVEHYRGIVMDVRVPAVVRGNIKNLSAFNIQVKAAARNNFESFQKSPAIPCK